MARDSSPAISLSLSDASNKSGRFGANSERCRLPRETKFAQIRRMARLGRFRSADDEPSICKQAEIKFPFSLKTRRAVKDGEFFNHCSERASELITIRLSARASLTFTQPADFAPLYWHGRSRQIRPRQAEQTSSKSKL